MPHQPQLTVEIRRTGEGQYLAITSRAGGAEVCQSTFAYADGLLVDIEPQWLLERAVPRHAGEELRRGPTDAGVLADEERKLADYGRRLYSFLFGDGTRFRQFLEFNDDYRRGARLTLALHKDAAALWRLPWEYLCDDAGFLALSGRFLLSRMPLGLGELTPDPVEPPLRILVVIAAPDDQRPLDTEEEIRIIQVALDEAVRDGRVQVDYLDDATLPAIGDALHQLKPHVLHYTGHGAYDKQAETSVLALEDDDGCTKPAGIADLRPYLADDPALRLAVLSGCQTARTSDMDAFAGVATGLLAEGVPAVLAMQSSILDPSAIELASAFYAAIAEGATPLEAAQRSRLALKNAADGPGYDWGVPSLYQRAANLRLVTDSRAGCQPAPTRTTVIDVGGLPLPPHFVGRKAELRTLRHALRNPAVNAAFVRGIGGMGKSTIAAKLIQRPGVPLDGTLVIRCNQVAALDIPAKLASWLAARGIAGHAEAAGLLLDSRLDPADRTRQALALLGGKRYLLVFDNFESVMAVEAQAEVEAKVKVEAEPPSTVTSTSAYRISDPILAGFFEGLLDAQWRGMCLFTGRYRWTALDERLGRASALEAHLPGLTLSQAVMLMDNLPRLRRQPLATKAALYRKVGGHPKSIELLEGWLASGQITDLLADDRLAGMLADQWAGYFLDALLAQLTEAERESLTRLCIFETLLDDELLAYAEIRTAWVTRWLDLSLLQREDGGAPAIPPHMQGVWDLLPESEKLKLAPPATYTVHPVVREYLTGRMTKDERLSAHEWAAAYYGRPFVEMARQVVRPGVQVTEKEIESFARDANGVVGKLVARTDDMAQARVAMGRALAWRGHLFAAGVYEPAGEIVTAVWLILARWSQRDRAKALLAESVATLETFGRAVAQGNLAALLADEGRLAEALAIVEAVYHTFEGEKAQPQIAATLGHMGNIYQCMGEFDKAIEMQERAMTLNRELGDQEGQAISLHQLTSLYLFKKHYAAALDYGRMAEALAREVVNEAYVATILHTQGLIYTDLARTRVGEMEAAQHRQAAFDLFAESLAINRRIGNKAVAADSLGELGKLHIDAGRMREAIETFNEALEINARLGNPAKVGIIMEFLGSVHERQGQLTAAREKFQQALELVRKYGSPQNVEIVEQHIARVREKMGNG
jgi:tetratricopeptide (TPR) repeat protein